MGKQSDYLRQMATEFAALTQQIVDMKETLMAEWDDLKKTVADLGVKVDAAVAKLNDAAGAPSKDDIKKVTSDIAAGITKLDKATKG